MSGLYVHIPFCRKACSYCDFHFSTSLRQKNGIVDALTLEIAHRANELKNAPETLYFGGGTPSLLEVGDMEQIMDALHQSFHMDALREVTLEANPEDVSNEKLRAWRDMSINRLSIGTQSFFEEDLKFMNRDHSPKQAETSVKRAQDAGYSNITIDLIYGIPQQSHNQWQENVGRALDLKTTHLSSYCLTIEPRTALHKAMEKGEFAEKDEGAAEAEFQYLHQALEAEGLEHYEISNFARQGFRALHNGNYWSGAPYLGIGPSAHSFDGQLKRGWNVANNARYIKALTENSSFHESEVLTPKDRMNEVIMTSLRTKAGINLQTLANDFSPDLLQQLLREADGLTHEMKGWIVQTEDSIHMNPMHWLKCDAVVRELFL